MPSSLSLLSGLLLAAVSSETVAVPDSCVAFVPSPAPALAPQDGKREAVKKQKKEAQILQLLTKWLKIYRKGGWDFNKAVVGTGSLLRKTSLADSAPQPRRSSGRGRGRRRGPTARDELRVLLYHASRIETIEAAKVVLQVAAVGLDRRQKYTLDMVPNTIRAMGEKSLLKMQTTTIRDYLVAAAKGDPGDAGGPSAGKIAMQAAALNVLAATEDAGNRRILEKQLAHHDPIIRTTVAEGLAKLGDKSTVKLLAAALGKEDTPSVIMAMLRAVTLIHSALENKVDVIDLRHAVENAGKLLGQTDSWPADLVIVDFLERFRYRESIPNLIGMLERFLSRPDDVKSGRLTLRLRRRLNEALNSLTGAFHRMDRPEKWREFWERERENIKIPEKLAREKSDGATKGGEFFGIPVRGTRVVFIIDISGSMAWPMGSSGSGSRTGAGGGAAPKGAIAKIDKAKLELRKAVAGLPPETKFNVILYADKVFRWQTQLVHATDKNKRALSKRLEKERANGSTNLFGALKLGLELKSLVYAERYDSNVDEVFVLSDGVPTSGEVIRMDEILRLVTETNRYSGVRINTIYLAPPNERQHPGGRGQGGIEGGRFMRELAEKNGGRFVWPGHVEK